MFVQNLRPSKRHLSKPFDNCNGNAVMEMEFWQGTIISDWRDVSRTGRKKMAL
jgi:hypothetical protein